jgi:hypothetical protein
VAPLVRADGVRHRLIFLRYLRQTLRGKVAVVFGALRPLLYLVLFGPLLSAVTLPQMLLSGSCC